MYPAPEYDARYLAGIALFNRGDYFAAHEVWEDLWRATPGPGRRFLQSLIQAAVALYHNSRGNAAGARSLSDRGRAKVAGLPPQILGLDLAGLWTAVAAFMDGGPPPTIHLDPLPRGPDHD